MARLAVRSNNGVNETTTIFVRANAEAGNISNFFALKGALIILKIRPELRRGNSMEEFKSAISRMLRHPRWYLGEIIVEDRTPPVFELEMVLESLSEPHHVTIQGNSDVDISTLGSEILQTSEEGVVEAVQSRKGPTEERMCED